MVHAIYNIYILEHIVIGYNQFPPMAGAVCWYFEDINKLELYVIIHISKRIINYCHAVYAYVTNRYIYIHIQDEGQQ